MEWAKAGLAASLVAATVTGAAAGLLAFNGAGAVAAGTTGPTPERPTSSANITATLPDGRTLGGPPKADPITGLAPMSEMPDLLRAVADNGREGYIDLQAAIGPLPTSPADAVAFMKAKQNGITQKIPVYDSDGRTIIGEFSLSDGQPRPGVSEPPP